MSDRISLRELLQKNADKELLVDEDNPMAVFCAEQLWSCRAVLDKTAILVSLSNGYDRSVVRHEHVMVDPDVVRWRPPVVKMHGHDGAPPANTGKNRGTWYPQTSTASKIDPDQRAKSDERARKNQEQVAAATARELEASLARSRTEPDARNTGITGISDGNGGTSAGEHREPLPIVVPDPDDRPVGTCAKCGQRGRLDPAGLCQRHQSRPPRRGIKLRTKAEEPRTPAPSRTPPQGDGTEDWHGTLGGYKNHGCRCGRCKKANADQHRDYMAGRRSEITSAREVAGDQEAALADAHRKLTPEEKRQDEFDNAVKRLVREGHPEPLKYCRSCQQEKPRSAFPPGPGFAKCFECREAQTVRSHDYRLTIARNLELAEKGQKWCPRCETGKPFEAFNKNASKSGGLQSICRDCQSNIFVLGSTGARRVAKGVTEGVAIATESATAEPSNAVVKPEPTVPDTGRPRARKNGRPALTFKEQLADLRRLKEYLAGLEQECAQLRTANAALEAENRQLRADQAELFTELTAFTRDFARTVKPTRKKEVTPA